MIEHNRINPNQPTLPAEILSYQNVPYLAGGHERQKLDLYLPGNRQNTPLIIWIRGGGFQLGNKEEHIPFEYLSQSYAVASISYRLSQDAIFPAQIEDCKAAVRWLRLNADIFSLNPERFGVWGESARGNLAALLGTTGNVNGFDVGENLAISSQVQAVVDYFGPTDFLQMDAHTYVTESAPPFLIVHDECDPNVPQHPSERLEAALKKAGVPVTLYTVKGAGPGGFNDPEVPAITRAFLAAHLQPEGAPG